MGWVVTSSSPLFYMKLKHYKFDSKHLSNFVVLEERRGNISLFPHTGQLAVLHEALEKEFRAPLSQLISRVNAYSDDYWKIARKVAVFGFCNLFNSGRADRLRLFCLLDQNKVARITIVQQITEHTPLGACHRFKFYGGPGFIQEIRMSGKQLVFADHVIKRFKQRAHNLLLENLSSFLYYFYGAPIIGMSINNGDALVVPSLDDFLAFTYEQTDTEYFITTCLDQSMVYKLKVQLPAKTFNLHYGESFVRPNLRNWNPLAEMFGYEKEWQEKNPLEPLELPALPEDWAAKCQNVIPILKQHFGHGADSQLHFLDDIPGPCTIELTHGEALIQFNEAEFLAENLFETIRDMMAEDPTILPGCSALLTKNDIAAEFGRLIDLSS